MTDDVTRTRARSRVLEVFGIERKINVTTYEKNKFVTRVALRVLSAMSFFS